MFIMKNVDTSRSHKSILSLYISLLSLQNKDENFHRCADREKDGKRDRENMIRERYAVGGEARERYEVKDGKRVKGRWIEKDRVR